MFIEQYRLESNPFAPHAARPLFASHSLRHASAKLQELIEARIHCLFVSGPAGVGKSTLARQRLRGLRATMSWLEPGFDSGEALLRQLVHDLGPGSVDGTVGELRNILEVFLRHQSGNGRYSCIVADGLERFSDEALRELEALSQLRLRNRPVVYLLMLTRNEDLASNLLPQHHGGPLSRAVHQHLVGLTLDETRAYVRTCLHGVGCAWSEELIPDEVIFDVQGFTQGVVGDINALCGHALEAVAKRGAGDLRHPRITRALLKEVGSELHLRYDTSPWAPGSEVLSAEAVHLSDPGELRIDAARLIVSSGDDQIAEITLNRPRMVLGRDASCDISLDSMHVSRYQNLFMETMEGWLLIDLTTTNACFVNGRRVKEHRLRDGDLIAVGQHQLRFSAPKAPSCEPRDTPSKTDAAPLSVSAVVGRPT